MKKITEILLNFVSEKKGDVHDKQFKLLRLLVGLPYMIGSKSFPAEPTSNLEEVKALLKQINPYQWLLVGYGIPAFVLWLMIFKPF